MANGVGTGSRNYFSPSTQQFFDDFDLFDFGNAADFYGNKIKTGLNNIGQRAQQNRNIVQSPVVNPVTAPISALPDVVPQGNPFISPEAQAAIPPISANPAAPNPTLPDGAVNPDFAALPSTAGGSVSLLPDLNASITGDATDFVELTNAQGESGLFPRDQAEGEAGAAFLRGETPAPGSEEAGLTTGQKFGVAFAGLNALSGLFNAYQGFRATKLAEDQFDFAQDTTRANFANQATTINNQFRDRETRRALETGQRLPAARNSAEDFVNTFGVSGSI